MAASASGQAPQASLLSLLTALSIHLTPFPLLYALPSALQLFAHFQLVSERIKAEAARALREDEKLRTTSSALNEKERRRVERWAGRDAVDAMLGFSVEFRKHVSVTEQEKTLH